MSRVSIILPAYNAGHFLSRTIKSALVQIYKNWELIVVDDFSQDDTRQIIKKFEAADDRIRSIFLDKNSGGPAHPKNVGIASATGKYIAFLDHDDEWLPEKLERQVEFFEGGLDDKCGLVTCDFFIDGKNGVKYITPIYDPRDQIARILNGNFVHSCSSIVVRREVLDRVGNFDETLKTSDDWDFYLRLLLAGYHIGVVPEKLFVWHCRNESAGKVIALRGKGELEYFLQKHKRTFVDYGAYGKKMVWLGLLYFFAGDFKKGRECARTSFDVAPSFPARILIILSFLRSALLFRLLFYVKKKISRNPLENNIRFLDVLHKV